MNDIAKTDRKILDRVVSILENARANVVRSVNANMVIAYWLIGREIVEGMQKNRDRAGYGDQLIENLSKNLTKRYEKGFSKTNLWYFKQFYSTYSQEDQILHTSGGESLPKFNPQLSWSHYRSLMKVKDAGERQFYENEAAECGWSKAQLERQIQTSYYRRIIANKGDSGILPSNRARLKGEGIKPADMLKSPYVLEFLGLPEDPGLHETQLEEAIISNLKCFLLELGKGFSFVARQKKISFDDDCFYVDLVFYNYILKCFLLIDLKMGKLTHRDIGQMDGYVRLFEDEFKLEGDNPTIGLILCSDKSETVAKYSVLNESKNLFAAKYLDFMPTEKQLELEIMRERKLIENNI
jgi:predicted nuclease of restriction endonuclease-like (RecB) superfamily